MGKRPLHRLRSFAAPGLVVAWLLAASASAQPNRVSDREVKATFLFNFAQFVDWPPSAFDGPLAPIVIGVLGDDPFEETLDDVVRGEVVKNRQLLVARFRNLEALSACHILFVSASETQRYDRILSTLRGRPTLTVGETDGFATHGGMVRFITDRNRVGLQVNVKAARSAGLTISSNLLRPARIVDGGN